MPAVLLDKFNDCHSVPAGCDVTPSHSESLLDIRCL